MIIYFTGTGNSLYIAKNIADATGDSVMSLAQATREDLTKERRIGLIFPSYDFNVPPAVRRLVPLLRLNPKAYLYIVISCGAQAGNCIHTMRRILRGMGIEAAYSHKLRVPDNSAIAFGRNPNEQVWKFEKFAPRLRQIIADVQAEKHTHHFATWSLLSWIMGRPGIERWAMRQFRPKVNADKCTACGTCAKVCPIGNISLTDKALVGDDCTACLACVHACPHQAVELRNKPTPKPHQYRNPSIKLNELAR